MTITNNQSTNFQIARFIKREHDEISIILVSNNATKTLEIKIENQSWVQKLESRNSWAQEFLYSAPILSGSQVVSA